jgi:anti-sigma regulatory factor (Ser/Thr protein kinase)
VRATVEPSVLSRATSELRLTAQPSQLGLAREYARYAAAAFGLDEERCYEVVCAFNEAVTNAIRHGRPDQRGQIDLSVLSDGERLTLAVRDYGTFVASAVAATPTSEGGRGFALMAGMMDSVELRTSPGSTVVLLSKDRI